MENNLWLDTIVKYAWDSRARFFESEDIECEIRKLKKFEPHTHVSCDIGKHFLAGVIAYGADTNQRELMVRKLKVDEEIIPDLKCIIYKFDKNPHNLFRKLLNFFEEKWFENKSFHLIGNRDFVVISPKIFGLAVQHSIKLHFLDGVEEVWVRLNPIKEEGKENEYFNEAIKACIDSEKWAKSFNNTFTKHEFRAGIVFSINRKNVFGEFDNESKVNYKKQILKYLPEWIKNDRFKGLDFSGWEHQYSEIDWNFIELCFNIVKENNKCCMIHLGEAGNNAVGRLKEDLRYNAECNNDLQPYIDEYIKIFDKYAEIMPVESHIGHAHILSLARLYDSKIGKKAKTIIIPLPLKIKLENLIGRLADKKIILEPILRNSDPNSKTNERAPCWDWLELKKRCDLIFCTDGVYREDFTDVQCLSSRLAIIANKNNLLTAAYHINRI